VAQGQVRARARARAEGNPNRLTFWNVQLRSRRYIRNDQAKKYDGSPNYLLTKTGLSNHIKSQLINALFPPNLDMNLNRVFIHKPGSVRASPASRVPRKLITELN